MSSVDPDKMEIRQLYDQTAAETDYAAKLTGPHHYKIIFTMWKYRGKDLQSLIPIKIPVCVGTYTWGNSWDPTDDWSYQELKIEESNYTGTPARNNRICVYDAVFLWRN